LILSLALPTLFLRGADNLKVTFLNVGKADTAVVQPAGKKAILIDAGGKNENYDAGQSVVIPFLQWSAINSLDGIIISHPEMDHMGGMLSVLRRFPAPRLWWNKNDYRPSHLMKIISSIESSGGEVLPADRNAPPLRPGETVIRFLNGKAGPVGDNPDKYSANNDSVVCRVQKGRVSFLFVGDLEMTGEEALSASGVSLKATALKVGHHGCRTSSSAQFLEAVRPKAAVISCHDYRGKKCPDPGVMKRLEAVGAKIFWTGRDGVIIMETDGDVLRVRTGKNPSRVITILP
jgi:competence protein ComEC